MRRRSHADRRVTRVEKLIRCAVSAGRRRTARGRLGDEGRAHDRRRLLRVPLALGERLVDLLEGILVRDQLVERPARTVPHQEVERARDHPGVVLDHAHDRLRAPDEQRRLELHLGAAADRADLEVGAAGAEHLDALRDHLGEADEVARDVGARAARPLPHERDALLLVGDLLHVERVVGAERPRERQAARELVHDDDRRRAHVLGHRRRLDPEAARPLDHDAPAEAEPRPVEAEDHLAQRAVHRRHQLVRQRVGHEEERAARPEVVVLGEGAVEVRELRGPDRPLDLGRARRGFSVQTRVAAPARVEVGVGDPVALLERAAERVGRDARAEPRDAPRHLVAEEPAVVGQAQRRVAAPEVEVRAADVRERHADQDRVGLELGNRQLADLERLAGAEEDGGLALAHRRAPFPTSNASWRARTASSAYLSSMTHETAISEVEIIWMLMPSWASVVNIFAATPEWLRMPTPTIETLATRSSWTTPWAPMPRAIDSSVDTARAWSPRGMVKDMSV